MAEKVIHTSGKRKQAIARATLKPGVGKIRINSVLLNYFEPKLARLRIKEPLMLVGNLANQLDINLNVRGGGVMAQAEAARLAIARALVEFTKDEKLEDEFLKYDRHLLVADIRRKETRKPGRHGKARSKRQKSYR